MATFTATRSRRPRPAFIRSGTWPRTTAGSRTSPSSSMRRCSTSSRRSTPTAGPTGSPGRTRRTAPGAARSPIDDDRDGLFDEDGYDDLNGDGQITQMRKKDPNGRFKLSPDDPRLLVPVKPGEKGEYEQLGIGRDRQRRRRPRQRGSARRLRHEPELAGRLAARAHPGRGGRFPAVAGPRPSCIAAFILDHPNIAGVQAFHNAAGMILRGPGHPSRQAAYPAGRRPDRRGDRRRRRQDDPILSELGDPQRPIQRPRRVRELDLRASRDFLVHQRALERRAAARRSPGAAAARATRAGRRHGRRD